MKKILVIGAGGQIGSELVLSLRDKYSKEQVIASDIKKDCPKIIEDGSYKQLDILDRDSVRAYVVENGITDVYLLAALLSATAEKNPDFAWKLNMEGLFTILDLAKEGHLNKVFWPSSIAVFGPTTPRENTPQVTVMEPTTVYGISKLAGERWCEYYADKYNVDVRSIRYPGLISYTSLPGGGTTDYAVDIFYKAKLENSYNCFLSPETELPMMYMKDAIRATVELMEAPKENIKVRSSYNLSGCSFTPKELSSKIASKLKGFEMSYSPDFRQEIADSWPRSIDDSQAQQDWGWKSTFNVDKIVDIMLEKVDEKIYNLKN